jgi:hypothetical protein
MSPVFGRASRNNLLINNVVDIPTQRKDIQRRFNPLKPLTFIRYVIIQFAHRENMLFFYITHIVHGYETNTKFAQPMNYILMSVHYNIYNIFTYFYMFRSRRIILRDSFKIKT